MEAGIAIRPDLEMVEQFTRWRFTPYPRGFLIRVQLYGGYREDFNEQWRIACVDQEQPSEHVPDKKHAHWRKEVADMDGLVNAMRVLAMRAAEPRRTCNIAVAPSLFEDGISMTKGDVAWWLGFGLDFDAASKETDKVVSIKRRVGPFEGMRRLASAGKQPRAVILTGSRWINGHGAEPKLHAIYSFERPVPADAIEEAERAVKKFTTRMGADPSCAECSRVLRLPGSVHPTDLDKQGNVLCPASLCSIEYLETRAL